MTIRTLEACGLRAWPARETVAFAGWLLGCSGGRSRRANAAHPCNPDGEITAVIDEAERFYRTRGQPVVFRITPLAPAGAGAALTRAGYACLDHSLVITRSLPSSIIDADPGVRIASTPDPIWRDGSAAVNGLTPADAVARDGILSRIRPSVGFATALGARLGDPPTGYGLAVVEQAWVGLFAIVIAPEARRQGVGRRIVESLLHWGQTHGAQAAYLQVGAANAPALSLYGTLGFATAYPYHYRVKD